MRYFFYEYRIDQIARFVREAHGRSKRLNPQIQMTAAVFKIPFKAAGISGRSGRTGTPGSIPTCR
ncbi:MAG: hypothetical protein WDO73_12215 [Ignavibacteriota bacterium]